MSIEFEITEVELRSILRDWISQELNISLNVTDIDILVKSKQNYKSEWEKASFKATVSKQIIFKK